MMRNFRFAIVSDLHIALPETVWDNPSRFHLVEISIPVLETIFDRLRDADLDFLLIPGDLTQHGEPENHRWLASRLAKLPYPAFVIPGNHDVPVPVADDRSIGLGDFTHYYGDFGYDDRDRLYYTRELLPGLHLIGLNSNQFDAEGRQLGVLDSPQLQWLEEVLDKLQNETVLVMVHHNIIEHLPGQSQNKLGRRYMLDNAPVLREMLRSHDVQLVFTGHLHVQDVAGFNGVYDITTGSTVTYPHPYRILEYYTDLHGNSWLQIESGRVEGVEGWNDLSRISRTWMGDRSRPFMLRLLTGEPLNLSQEEAEPLVPSLRYFWANIADGDAQFDFAHFPPKPRRFFESFSATLDDGSLALIDNHVALKLRDCG
ncbi:metallophosphoesterase family protein [Baaleninema simplex]|uniref:metallophosphoesterase family protein n=1 Tax=Baaleninema simplex TaxID=2862350 RepID=UPI0011817ED3|nr:metallophosphoesterase [Baaleninema simplex]